MTDTSDMHELFDRMRDVEREGQSNRLGLQSHERECAIRYAHINQSVTGLNTNMDGMRKEMRMAVGVIGTIMFSALAFLIKRELFP